MRRTPVHCWVHTLLLALFPGGCIFDTSGLTPGVVAERSVLEGSNGGDVGSSVDETRDLAPPDQVNDGPDDETSAADAQPAGDVEQAPDTKPAPDIKPAPDSTPLTLQQLCTAKYGKADSFYYCAATATSCTFYVKTNEDTCQNLCTSFGGGCLGGYDNSGYCSSTGQQSSCGWVHSTQICICTL